MWNKLALWWWRKRNKRNVCVYCRLSDEVYVRYLGVPSCQFCAMRVKEQVEEVLGDGN